METLIDTAAYAGNFTTLIGLLQAGSLIDTLRTTGPYTLFAPTDAAFRRLEPGTLDTLMKDTGRLCEFLALHVIPGLVVLNDVAGENKTIEGASLTASRSAGEVFVNGVRIARADVEASNGVLHVIDEVLLPLGETLPAA